MAKEHFDKEKALKKLCAIWYEGHHKYVKYSILEQLGFNTKKTHIEIGNFLLSQYTFLNYYEMSIIDNDNDLNGNPLDENTKALKYIQSVWLDDERSIDPEDLEDFAIDTKLSEFTIGNFFLKKGLFSSDYALELDDEERDINGLIIDGCVTIKYVLDDLKNISIKSPHNHTEKYFEEILYKYLSDCYENVNKQVSIGGTNSLKIDLDIGNGAVGIELKLAEKLTIASEKQRLIGQIYDYTAKRYKNSNFIVAVVGSSVYKSNTSIKDVSKIVKGLYKCHYIYIITT